MSSIKKIVLNYGDKTKGNSINNCDFFKVRNFRYGWSTCLHVRASKHVAAPTIIHMSDRQDIIKRRYFNHAGHVARMEEGRGVHRVLVGKPEGKGQLGRPRRRWEDNIEMDLEEVGRGCGDWMELAQDRDRWRALVSTVMNFGVP